MTKYKNHTPMMQQYLTIKENYQDAFLFYRLGDFYELFFDDAIKASQILEITLTSRNKNSKEQIPMAGVPYHSVQSYIDQLIELGYKVAICEQVEDPKLVQGMVKREVVQVITPGTVVQGDNVSAKENNYLAAVMQNGDGGAIAYADLSTGELKATELSSYEDILNELRSLEVKEVIFERNQASDWQKDISSRLNVLISSPSHLDLPTELDALYQHLESKDLKQAAQLLLAYVSETQMRSLDHLQKVDVYQTNHFLLYGPEVHRNLELTTSLRDGSRQGTLLWLLDQTKTAMGARLLRRWLDKPLITRSLIEDRLDKVENLINHFFDRSDLTETLTRVYDLERLVGRIAYGTVNARDLNQLKQSLFHIPIIQTILEQMNTDGVWTNINEQIDPVPEVYELIDRAIQEEVPIAITEGDIIRDGFDARLDQYRDAMRNGKQWLIDLEVKERETTGIKNLKIGFNKVFGYYIEITKSNLDKLDEGRYERKQTLANAERFITPELKEMEAKILEAEEKSQALEHELFVQVRQSIKEEIPRLQKLAQMISTVDVLQSLATVAEANHYVRPVFHEDSSDILIDGGRHPVVEQVMAEQEYVPNDVHMDEGRDILLITGPNMSGKSTYMRQMALLAIMAQMGSFVPADSAHLPIFDQIFTRIGAMDDLIAGQSTFMVEMTETNQALQRATSRSLLLFDEIGRGTATYDGMALAEAIIEYVHDEIGAKTLFSTHYHELTALEGQLSGVFNVHVGAVEEESGLLTFLHKIRPGSADKSYGVQVARLAGLPDSLLSRASEILADLEANRDIFGDEKPPMVKESDVSDKAQQLELFSNEKESIEHEIIEEIKDLDMVYINPMQAFERLKAIKEKLLER